MAKSNIIKDIVNDEINISTALNRLLIIASDTNNSELMRWAECELSGYKKGEQLPDYRIVQNSNIVYTGINGNLQVTRQPLPMSFVSKEDQEFIKTVEIRDAIASLELLVTENGAKNHLVRDLTWLSGEIAKNSSHGVNCIICVSITQEIPQNTIQNIIGEIKTRLLRALLSLEKAYGCLDNLDIDISVKSSREIERTNQVINNYIIGDKNNINRDTTKNEISESTSHEQREPWYKKLFWKLVISIIVVVIGAAIILWLNLK